MSTFKPERLESIQNYHWMWEHEDDEKDDHDDDVDEELLKRKGG